MHARRVYSHGCVCGCARVSPAAGASPHGVARPSAGASVERWLVWDLQRCCLLPCIVWPWRMPGTGVQVPWAGAWFCQLKPRFPTCGTHVAKAYRPRWHPAGAHG
jgi:hypothetical protein